MKSLVLCAAFSIFILFAIQGAFSQEEKGRVESVKIFPEEPVVAKEMTVTANVKNPSGESLSYKLKLRLVKDGKVLAENTFTFDIGPGLSTTVTSAFVPNDIGNFEVVAELSDRFELEKMDVEVVRINVASDIGPFDVIIESPSRIVPPGVRTPILLTLANMGKKGTDVQVKINMDCYEQEDIGQEFFIFVPADSVLERTLATDTCFEVGPRAISASIILFNRTWISAFSQIFLNESTISILFEPPAKIETKAGESKLFNIEVTNNGKKPLTSMRLFMPKIPQEWLMVEPDVIKTVQPNQTVLFIVNITPAIDAPESELKVGITIASDQSLERQETDFKIISFQGGEIGGTTSTQTEGEFPISLDFGYLLNINILLMVGIAIAAVVGFVVVMKFRKIKFERKEHLKKIKKSVSRYGGT